MRPPNSRTRIFLQPKAGIGDHGPLGVKQRLVESIELYTARRSEFRLDLCIGIVKLIRSLREAGEFAFDGAQIDAMEPI